MISCGFQGRLGNNLFQIATALSIAKKVGTDIILPEQSYCGHRGARNVDLSIFEYDFKRGNLESPCFEYNEPTFHYTEIPCKDNMRLSGFYQSWKYFDDIKFDLKHKYFKPSAEVNKGLAKYSADGITLGISVRRGDYLMLQHNHCVLGLDYYQEALNKFSEKVNHIYVFSDDIDWCRTVFDTENVTYVDDTPAVQLFLMAEMDHLILSNSTFAWWGAYLNDNNGTIIAPDPWFGPNIPHDTSDLYMPHWAKMKHTIETIPYTMSNKFFD